MPTRRTVIAVLAATPVMIAFARRAAAAPRPGQLYRGRAIWDEHARVRGKTVVGLTGGGRAVLGRRMRATDPHLYSLANANDRYAAWLDIGRQPRQRELYLALPDGWAAYGTSSWSLDSSAEIWFEVSAANAAGLAARWNIPLQDRVALDGDLVTRFQPRTRITDQSDPILIDLLVENRGTTKLHLWTSPHVDDNFALAATLDGVAVPAVPPGVSIGPMGLVELAPGTTATVTADLRRHVTITRGGVYSVTCQFNGALVLDPTTFDAAHAHRRWDLTATGAIDVRVE